jgi:hypothetical protein
VSELGEHLVGIMGKASRRWTRRELEASRADRTVKELFERYKDGNTAFMRRAKQAVGDGLIAAQKVLEDGGSVEYANTVFSFTCEATLVEAIHLLPPYYLGTAEFSNLPVAPVGEEPISKWSRCELAGRWVIICGTAPGRGVFFRPEIEDAPSSHN